MMGVGAPILPSVPTERPPSPPPGGGSLSIPGVVRRLLRAVVSRAQRGLDSRAVGVAHSVESLDQQAATMRALTEGSADLVWAKDRDGVYQLVNTAAACMLGRSKSSIIGRTDAMLFPAHSAAEIRARDEEAMRTGASLTSSSAVTTSDGTLRHFITTRTVWRDASGAVIGLVGVSRDVTADALAQAALRAGEQRYRVLVEDAPEAIVVHRDGIILYVNATGAQLVGVPDASHLVGRRMHDFAHPDSKARLHDAIVERERGHFDPTPHEYRMLAPDGRIIDVEALSVAVEHDGAPAIQTVLRDVTTRREAEAALRDRETRLRLVMQQIPAVLWATDVDGRFTSAAGAGLGALGIDASELVGQLASDYFASVNQAAPSEATRDALGGRSTSFEFEWGHRAVSCNVEPLRSAAGDIEGTLGLAVDITDRKVLETQLTYRAFHDPLTGLANRELFRNRLTHALTRLGRGGHVAVLFLDLDDFKTVNDSLGHTEGDRLLKGVAARLKASVRGHDTVARFGGDEFAILLEGMERPEEALDVVARVEGALAQPMNLRGRKMHVGGSIGLAHASIGETADEVLRNADVAMYRAKDSETERHAVYEAHMHAAVVDRLELESDLRVAIERNELYLLFQPVVALDSGEIQGFEALLRWKHPRRGTLAPATFVPLAEETGLVLELGRWTVNEACRALAELHALARNGAPGLHDQLRMGINISGHQFRSDAFIEQAQGAIEEAAVAPGRIVFEITEGTVMGRSTDTLRRLHALKQLGVQLAIDDFGTGYSSLGYLQQFPIDVLKVDRTFIEGVTDGGSNAALTRTILTLGELMHLRTLAEGVETHAQRLELLRMGCRFAQGYLFSRPLLAADVPGWAARHVKEWREAPRTVARRITREFEIASLHTPTAPGDR